MCSYDLKDVSIPELKMTKGISNGLSTINPYVKNEAETIAWSEGFKSSQNKEVGVFVTAKKKDAYIKVRDVDFRQKGASKLMARIGTTHNAPVSMELRLDKPNGTLLGTMKVPRTGGDNRWQLVETDIPVTTGVHDICFVVKGEPTTDLMYFDYWKFKE